MIRELQEDLKEILLLHLEQLFVKLEKLRISAWKLVKGEVAVYMI